MKLYTEEQVKFAMRSAYLTGVGRPPSYEEVEEILFNSLTPIEIPSDEEIDKVAFKIPYDNGFEFYDKSFITGAKWMRDKILNK